MDLREQVRGWLIDEKFGVLSAAELVALADRAIGELDDPPDYLFSLSLGESLAQVDRLDLLEFRPNDKDLGGLAERLLQKLEKGSLSLEEIAVIALNVCSIRYDDTEEAWMEFSWITDELHFIEQGIKDATGYRKGVVAALRMAAAAAWD